MEKGFTVTPIDTEEALMDQMTCPSPAVREAITGIDEDIMLLGAGGKMGPTLAQLMVRAGAKGVIGVDLFPTPGTQEYLEKLGVRTIQCDLLDSQALARLPDTEHIILAAGFKFGATGRESLTWAMNTLLPGAVMQRFPQSRIVYISSGNVYRFVSVTSGGATESDPVEPIGEYAQSRLGGERAVQFYSDRNGTPAVIVRLFYSTELRYGIIYDIASKVKAGKPIDVTMGHVNQIWQGDAASYIVRCFSLCDSPAMTINLTGPDVLSVRAIASRVGELTGVTPQFVGTESDTALLGNPGQIIKRMGPPQVPPDTIIQWVSWWVMHGGTSLGKPTKFEVRNGKF